VKTLRTALPGALLALLAGCDLLAPPRTPVGLPLTGRIAGDSAVPAVHRVRAWLESSRNGTRTLDIPYAKGARLDLGSIDGNNPFTVSLLGCDTLPTGRYVPRWSAAGQGTAGYGGSQVVELRLTVAPPAPSLAGDTSRLPATFLPGTKVWYTTDGSDPRGSWAARTDSSLLRIDSSCLLQAAAMREDSLGNRLWSLLTVRRILAPLPAVKILPLPDTSIESPTITLSVPVAGASLRYTLDGSLPTASSALYGAPFTLDSSRTVRVVALRDGWLEGPVATKSYVVTHTLPAPRISLNPGAYDLPHLDTLTSSDPAAVIRYTTDGSVPDDTSPLYTAPFLVNGDLTVQAIATRGSLVPTIATARYSMIPWRTDIAYDSFKDPRDGHLYRSLKIGSTRWMAQNLDYAGPDGTLGSCRSDVEDSCTLYGRTYRWSQALALPDSCDRSSCLVGSIQGVCPSGWWLPSSSDLAALLGSGVDSMLSAYRLGAKANGSGSYDAVGFRGLVVPSLGASILWTWQQESDTGAVGFTLLKGWPELFRASQAKSGPYGVVRCIRGY